MTIAVVGLAAAAVALVVALARSRRRRDPRPGFLDFTGRRP